VNLPTSLCGSLVRLHLVRYLHADVSTRVTEQGAALADSSTKFKAKLIELFGSVLLAERLEEGVLVNGDSRHGVAATVVFPLATIGEGVTDGGVWRLRIGGGASPIWGLVWH
jgi:hypothetical protein